jgi:hypothetical protein
MIGDEKLSEKNKISPSDRYARGYICNVNNDRIRYRCMVNRAFVFRIFLEKRSSFLGLML